MNFVPRIGTAFVIGLLGLFAARGALAQDGSQPVGGAPSVNPQGLSGTWASPSQPGSRILLQVLPDEHAPGKALLFGSWLTFNGIPTANDSNQRWYTLQSDMTADGDGTQLILYRNAGGDFDSTSPVTATPAGTATLSFTDCDHAALEFHFTEAARGAEIGLVDLRIPQDGKLALQREGGSSGCSTSASGAAAPSAIGGLSGAWYNPAKSGQGLWFDIDPLAGTFSAAWATFAPAGEERFVGDARQRWYTLRVPVSDLVSIPAIPIYSTFGATFGANSPAPTTVQVGTASLAFDDCNHATLNYTFTAGLNAGLSGTTPLAHLTNAKSCDTSTLAIPGQVALPGGIGASLASTDLIVIAGDDERPVSDDGTFSANRGAGAPILAWVMHKDGYAALIGFVDPAATSIRIDAHSSAVALMYMGLGSAYLPPPIKRKLIATLDAAAATEVLAAVIEARLRANPRALDAVDDEIAAALKSALSTVAHTAAVTGMRAEIKAFAADTAPAAASADAAQLLNITPSEQSGLTLLQSPDNAGIVVQNSKRREAIANVYKRAVVDEDGLRTEFNPVAVVHDYVPVPATAAVSVFNIVDILFGKAPPLAPVVSPTLPLGNAPGIVRTDFDVVVLTPVFGHRNPSALDAARFAAVRDGLNTRLDNMYVRAGMQITLGTLLEAFGVRGFQMTGPAFDAWLESFLATPSPSLAEFLLSLKTGDVYLKGAQRFILSVVDQLGRLPTAGEIQGAASEGLLGSKGLQKIIEVADPAMARMVAQKNLSLAMKQAKMTALRVSLAVGAIVSGSDVIAQLVDFSSGNAINLYTVNLLQPRVRLEPQNAKVNLGNTLTLKATVSGYTNDTNISYSWVLTTGDNSILQDDAGHSVAGNGTFDSTRNEVKFLTDNLITRTDVKHRVEVQAYYKSSSGSYQLIGKASTSITVDGFQVQLDPDQVTMRHDKQRAFGILVNPFPDDATLAALQFDWSAASNGRCGTLTSSGITNSASTPVVTTRSAHATYTGNASNPPNCPGDVVHVALFTMNGDVRTDLGSADAVIVFTDYDIVLPPVPNVQVGTTVTVGATLDPVPPANATVVWRWSVSGNGSLTSQTDQGPNGSSIGFKAGAAPGTAAVTVNATVTANGSTQYLQAKTRQIVVADTGVTPVSSGPLQFYTTDRCSIAYLTLPRLAGKNYYRITGVSGLNPLGNGPSNNTGGTTVVEPAHVFASLIYDVLDQTSSLSCAQSPLSSTLLGDATTLRLVVARALIIDGNPTSSWTAAWESEFRQAYTNASVNAEAFHSDITP
ncbi:MAG: hypothetical protein JSS42_06820 [Proteobacteria bacterium]|nr:hypothetical protein [Pseudomonadota bacterium]